jgi:LAGLIDADG endonuclease
MSTEEILELAETEKAWIAGIIDGEGCIRVQKTIKKDIPEYYMIEVAVQSRDQYMTRELQYLFPTSKISYYEKVPGAFMATWSVRGKRAYKLLKQIVGYLRVKHEQAGKAIEFHETFKSRFYSRSNSFDRNLQESYKQEISNLKHEIKLKEI